MSTVLTLVLVPALYELLYARREVAHEPTSCASRACLAGRSPCCGLRRRERRSAVEPRARRASTVVRPKRGDVVRSITLPGDLVGFYEAALYAKVTGYLKSIDVDKGDWVTKGQVLAEIEVPELEQKLQARARQPRRSAA